MGLISVPISVVPPLSYPTPNLDRIARKDTLFTNLGG